MKRDFLEAFGLDKETVDKVLDENSKDIGREKQKLDQVKADLAAAQEQLAQRDKDMEDLMESAGDVDEIKKQLADLQAKYTTETEQYQKQIADRDYADAVHRSIANKGVKFSSKAAEKAFIADLTANRLSVKDGALDGFEAYLKTQQEGDPAAFQSDKPAPTFVKPVGPGGPPSSESKGAMYAKQFNQMYTPKITIKE